MLLVACLILTIFILALGFLVLGAIRSLAIIERRLTQVEAIRPRSLDRGGLQIGAKAPGFELPDVDGRNLSIPELVGRRVLIVFVQAGCGPCKSIVPELARLHRQGIVHVVAINNGDVAESRAWSADAGAEFPVLTQENWSVSKQFKVLATPFAFLIGGDGTILGKGLVTQPQHIGYVLNGAGSQANGAFAKSG